MNKTDEELKRGPDSIPALYKQKYASSNLPMLTLCQVTPFQKGICATLDLESGTVLGEYLAHIGPQEVNDYTLSTYWQALTYRNQIAMANDGFPNARLVPIYNFQGLCKRYLLVALSPIKAREQICWDYTSSHPLKARPYLEFRGEALREFIGTCIPEEIKERMKKEVERQVKKKFNFDALIDQFKYLIETPVLLFKMVWDGSTQAAHLKELVNAFFRCISVENQEKILEGQLTLIQLAEQALKIKKRCLH